MLGLRDPVHRSNATSNAMISQLILNWIIRKTPTSSIISILDGNLGSGNSSLT